MKVLLGGKAILDNSKDSFMSVKQVIYSPDAKYFLVLGCGYECNDNIGYLFNSDGSGKRKITGRWDNILQDKVEWSSDSKKLYYYRIKSTGADPPANAPTEGWIEVNVINGAKAPAASRVLQSSANYSVFRVVPNDVLNMRESPCPTARIVAKLPYDTKGIKITGNSRRIGGQTWVPITHTNISGWVNQSYLYQERDK